MLLVAIGTAFLLAYAPQAEPVLACAIPGRTEPRGYNIWVGYPRGFGWPEDTKWSEAYWYDTKLVLTAVSPRTPALVYVLPFDDLTYRCDSHGEHCGEHPCGAFAVAREVWEQNR